MTDTIKGDNERTKILFVSPYLPYPPDDGLKLRAYHLINEMLRLDYDVSLLCFMDDGEGNNINKFKKEFNIEITTIPFKKRFPSSLKRIFLSLFSRYPFLPTYYNAKSAFEKALINLTNETFDLLFLYDSTLALYGLDCDLPKILDSIDCQSDSAKNGFDVSKNIIHKIYWYLNYIKWKKFEKEVYTKYDVVITAANRDAFSLKSINGLKVSAVGNGIDHVYFKPLNLSKIPHSILFIGNMECFSNADAIQYFITEVYPIIKVEVPNAQLFVVGKLPSEISSFNDENDIIFLGYVDDVRTYIDKCEIVICPVRMATGIQNKVLVAMAMNKPIVSTKRAVGDIKNFINDKDIFIADDKYNFAQKIIQLFTNEELLKIAGKNGRNIVLENFSWKSSGSKLNSIITKLLKSY